MKNASAALKTFLANAQNTQVLVADLLTIVPLVGPTTRLTSWQASVTVVSQYDNASHAFSPMSSTVPGFRRGRTRTVVGLEVDSLDLTLMTDYATQTFSNGLSWPAAARAGLLDGATIVLERLFRTTLADVSLGTLITFWGRVAKITPSRSTVLITVESDLAILGLMMPRNVYQPKCLHVLYDAGCALVRATYQVSGAVVAGGTASAVRTNLTQANGYFELGTITFTSGALNGLTATVKKYLNANGTVTPVAKLLANPAAGDTFNIVPGCDKTYNTCNNKFSNLAHFRGYPFIPSPETAG